MSQLPDSTKQPTLIRDLELPGRTKVVAKFTVESRTELNGGSRSIRLTAVTGEPEDRAFWEATPAGEIELQLVNPQTADLFSPGKSFFGEFSLAPAA